MIEINVIFNILSSLTPAVSALLWAAIMVLSIKDSMTQKEKNIKNIIFWFFIVETVGWVAIVLYTYWPMGFVYMNAAAYFSFLVRHVLFYRFIIFMTQKPKEKFPVAHYIIPLLISGVLFVWSFFVPLEIQLKLVEGHGAIVPDYLFYSRAFLIKPLMNFIYSAVYLLLITIRLWRYYTKNAQSDETIGRPAPWVTLLMSFATAYFIFGLASLFVSRNLVFSSTSTLVSIVILLMFYMILGYNIIRRNFMLYIPVNSRTFANVRGNIRVETHIAEEKEKYIIKREYKRRTKMIQTVDGKIVYKKLTQRRFEEYFRKNKPWLNPKLKMTDLLEPLETNRTILSGFINQTYRMNFNSYINRLRLQEVGRLRQLSDCSELSLLELVSRAGFASLRNYMRAQEIEGSFRNDSTKEIK